MATQNLLTVKAEDLKLGAPLPFSIYDRHGTLLLRQGVVINIPAQRERLLADGVYLDGSEPRLSHPSAAPAPTTPRRPTDEPKLPTFLRAEQFCTKLQSLFIQLIRTPEQVSVTERAGELAAEIQQAAEEDYVSLVAALHVDHTTTAMVIHQVFGAVLVELVGKRAEIPPAERTSLICAALTRDLGQVPLQRELDRIEGPLPDLLRQKVRAHPTSSIEMLRRSGVADALWLEAVEQHHERLDGSGYPKALKADAVGRGGRLLAVCDTYSAMVKPRPYRANGQANHTQFALREIFSDHGTTYDANFAALLIKTIGVLPPGSIVKLKCGEIAIVRDYVNSIANAKVYAIYDKSGMPMLDPPFRSTSVQGYEIVGMAHYSECRSVQLIIKSLWLKGK